MHDSALYILTSIQGADKNLRFNSYYTPTRGKSVLDNERGLIFTIDHLLSDTECNAILDISEKEGFDSLEKVRLSVELNDA